MATPSPVSTCFIFLVIFLFYFLRMVAYKVLPSVGTPLACKTNIDLEDVELLPCHSASLTDQKVVVYGGMTLDGKASNNM